MLFESSKSGLGCLIREDVYDGPVVNFSMEIDATAHGARRVDGDLSPHAVANQDWLERYLNLASCQDLAD